MKALFWRSKRGAVAVEFAIVGVVFFNVLFSIMQIAIVLLHETGVQNGVSRLARAVEAGDVNADADIIVSFCSANLIGRDCASKINARIDSFENNVEVGNAIRDQTPPWIDANTNAIWGGTEVRLTNNGPVLVRAYFSYPLFVPYLHRMFETDPDSGERLIGGQAVAVWFQ